MSKWAYAIAALLVCALLAGTHWKAFKYGVATDKIRSDGEAAQKQADAANLLLEANAKIKAQSEALQATKERAERDLQTERARNARRLADAAATSDLVRDQLAEFARGQQSGDDTAAAASERAAELGRLLGESMQLQAELAGAAEDHAASVRALLNAWPTNKGTP